MSQDRKAAVEELAQERGRLFEQCQELETRLKASKSRNKIVENESSKLKSQLQVLIEKSSSG
jgi:predicted nuclease with TOPRIM domain